MTSPLIGARARAAGTAFRHTEPLRYPSASRRWREGERGRDQPRGEHDRAAGDHEKQEPGYAEIKHLASP